MRSALVLTAAALAASFAAPAVAGPEVPEINACILIPMRYPEVVDEVVGAVYTVAPPVRDAVWAVCGL